MGSRVAWLSSKESAERVSAWRQHSHYGNSVVIKDRGYIFGREFVCCVTDEKAGLANSPITNNYTSIASFVSPVLTDMLRIFEA